MEIPVCNENQDFWFYGGQDRVEYKDKDCDNRTVIIADPFLRIPSVLHQKLPNVPEAK